MLKASSSTIKILDYFFIPSLLIWNLDLEAEISLLLLRLWLVLKNDFSLKKEVKDLNDYSYSSKLSLSTNWILLELF